VTELLEEYSRVVGPVVIGQLQQLARPLQGLKVVHVNSTREGGGVAEILTKMVPLKRALGLEASWEVISGGPDFFATTKLFHNALQGARETPGEGMLAAYERTAAENAERLRPILEQADLVVIHDPQPAALLHFCPKRRGKWVWRCHIDASRPNRHVWKYLRNWVNGYDASIFSLPEFAQRMPHPQYLIQPSIDPLSEKNMELPPEEVQSVYSRFGLDLARPIVLQVSRFDRFKDQLGVIEAYRLSKRHTNLQLVLAGGGASDDPEGQAFFEEVRTSAGDDEDIHVLLLPPDSHRTINALQRTADIVLQKSLKEGFGLTVTEAMWKARPVIGGDTGGIRLQVVNHYTGFLVRSPEGAALRIRYLLAHRDELETMGRRARRLVRENFLLTRHLREYLVLMIGLLSGAGERIEVGLSGRGLDRSPARS